MSVNGFLAGPKVHRLVQKNKQRYEYGAFFREASKSGNTLIFGHTIYEMMKSSDPDRMGLRMFRVWLSL